MQDRVLHHARHRAERERVARDEPVGHPALDHARRDVGQLLGLVQGLLGGEPTDHDDPGGGHHDEDQQPEEGETDQRPSERVVRFTSGMVRAPSRRVQPMVEGEMIDAQDASRTATASISTNCPG